MLKHTLFAFAALLVSLNTAQAAVIDFAGYHYDMDTVEVGDMGTIATQRLPNPHGYFYDYVEGILPSNTAITFTYKLKNTAVGNGFAEGMGQVSDGASLYRYWAASDGWINHEKAGADGIFSPTAPTFGLTTTAALSPNGKIATVVITNLADVAANFKSYYFSALKFGNGLVSTTYNVAAVPLPAALPLFGMGLIGLTALRRRRTA